MVDVVDVSTLKPGDRVKIVDRWTDGCNPNPQGRMDMYLGTEMTVREIIIGNTRYQSRAHMEEDRLDRHLGGWNWFGPAIEYVIDGDCSYDGNFDESDFMSMLK